MGSELEQGPPSATLTQGLDSNADVGGAGQEALTSCPPREGSPTAGCWGQGGVWGPRRVWLSGLGWASVLLSQSAGLRGAHLGSQTRGSSSSYQVLVDFMG